MSRQPVDGFKSSCPSGRVTRESVVSYKSRGVEKKNAGNGINRVYVAQVLCSLWGLVIAYQVLPPFDLFSFEKLSPMY